mgnify:CR=1 FL=1
MNLMVDRFPYFNNSTKDLLERIEELRKAIIHFGLHRLCSSNVENKQKLKKLLKLK